MSVFERGAIAELFHERRYDEALSRLYDARDERPTDGDITSAIHVVRDRMLRHGLERLGSLDAIPRRVRGAPSTGVLGSDEQYLLDLVRGSASMDELLDGSTLGRHRTVRGLVALLEQGLIELDVAPSARDASSPGRSAPEAIAAEQVLVADGNPSSAALTRTMLRIVLGGRAKLETCGTAAELASAVEKQRPDLIVVEFTLPGSDGLSALRTVRKLACGPVRTIVVAQRIELDFVSARAPERAVVLARPIEKTALLGSLTALGITCARGRT